MGGGKKSRHAKSSGVKQTSSQNDKESLDGARNQLEAVAECPAAAPTAAAAAAQEEPQTYPPCTVQMEAQFAFALSNDKIKHQLQRLFDTRRCAFSSIRTRTKRAAHLIVPVPVTAPKSDARKRCACCVPRLSGASDGLRRYLTLGAGVMSSSLRLSAKRSSASPSP